MMTARMFRWLSLVALALATLACGDDRSPSGPSRVSDYQIEFRVTGTATAATIRYTDGDNGMAQVVTALPWSARVRANQSVLLVSLDVTPVSFSSTAPPFIAAQIYVDGVLLREASATTFFQPLQVSATVRR